MIESLRIENVAVVEEAELEFGPGLNVLTGETGAGRTAAHRLPRHCGVGPGGQ